jgi:uncharacterized protein
MHPLRQIPAPKRSASSPLHRQILEAGSRRERPGRVHTSSKSILSKTGISIMTAAAPTSAVQFRFPMASDLSFSHWSIVARPTEVGQREPIRIAIQFKHDRGQDILSPEEKSEVLRAIETVRQTALLHLTSNKSMTFAIGFISNLHRGVDQVVQAAKDQGLNIDCKAGCSYCCNYRVEALAPEIFQIARELKKLPQKSIDKIIERLLKHAGTVKDVSVWDHHIGCPFLADHLCTIYEVRPAVCRKAHSLDVDRCKLPGSDIPGSLEIALKSEALIRGTADAYNQVKLCASGHYELGQAVLIALTDKTAELRWFGGELVFNGPCDGPNDS